MNYDFNYAVQTFIKANTEQFWAIDGRERRKTFWHYGSIFFIAMIAINIVASILGSILGILGTIVSLAGLVLVPAAIGMTIRRMHDIGQPWFMGLIPFYNLYLAAQPGVSGANEYGADPKA